VFYKIMAIYLLIMNIWGFLSMYVDKQKAIKGKYRIPEKVLFLVAIFGGSVGSILGMQICRHKTKHWYFVVFMPLILILHIITIYVLLA